MPLTFDVSSLRAFRAAFRVQPGHIVVPASHTRLAFRLPHYILVFPPGTRLTCCVSCQVIRFKRALRTVGAIPGVGIPSPGAFVTRQICSLRTRTCARFASTILIRGAIARRTQIIPCLAIRSTRSALTVGLVR